MKSTNIENMAMLSIALSGIAWGLLWIPLRALDEAGIAGVWAVVLFYVVPTLLLAPIFILRLRHIIQGGWSFHIAGILTGLALVLYAGALVFTDVVRALLFFYITPLWSTLLARAVLGEAITKERWVTIILALLGLGIILGLDQGINIDLNIGDWLGLASGVIWAFAAVYMKTHEASNATDFTLSYFLWGTGVAFGLTLLPLENVGTFPDGSAVVPVLWWLIPVVLFLAIPPAFAIMWGATILSPGIISILFMTEISAGAITAAIWAGEPFGLREALGVVLISVAGILEPALKMMLKTPGTPELPQDGST